LQETRLTVMQRRVNEGLQKITGGSLGKRESDRGSSRFTPYSRDQRGPGSSFRNGKDPRSPRVPCCLRCGEDGHRADSCKTSSIGSKKLKPASVWENNKLVDAASHRTFCFSWNFSPKGCRTPDDCRNLHACSLCGSKSHAASARNCL
jgi:hypothetical protein